MDTMPAVTLAAGRPTAQPTPRVVTNSPAKAFCELGTSCLRQGRYDEARFYLRESLRFQPDDWVTLNNLGALAWQMGRAGEAEGYFRRALEVAPDDYSTVNNLANLLWQQRSVDEAAPLFRRALTLRPDSPEAWMNLGAVLTDLAQFHEATECIQESLHFAPIRTKHSITWARPWLGRGIGTRPWHATTELSRFNPTIPRRTGIGLTLGWRLVTSSAAGPSSKWRLKCRSHIGLGPSCPRWNGEDLRGKTILLHCELGLGDTIQLIRLVAEVRSRNAGAVIAICSKPLGRLIATCSGIDFVAVEGSRLPPFDVHASFWSLPAILGITLANLPAPNAYLSVNSATIAHWRTAMVRALGENDIDHAIKVGVVWQGNPKLATDRERSFGLHELEPLAQIPGVRLISLQKGHGVDQLRELGGRFSVTQVAIDAAGSEDRRDFLDTAALIKQSDLVVTPDSAVAHLAGSLGARVSVALPFVAEWRWMLDREDSPWYPSMRLFRQTIAGDWPGVFQRMTEALEGEFRES